MILTEEQIAKGFWYYRPGISFPPKAITYPEQYNGDSDLNLVCTQLSIGSYRQRKLVEKWCNLLPELRDVRYLWLNSKVNQALFDSICENQEIQGLYIKWSGVVDLSRLSQLNKLQFLHIGSSTSVKSIDPLAGMSNLIVLEIENFKHIRDLSPLHTLKALEGLGVEGSMWTTQIIETLTPLCDLENLRYLFLTNLKTLDRTIRPLSRIKTLMNIRTSYWWPKSDFKLLRESLPNLKYGSPFESVLIEQFGK